MAAGVSDCDANATLVALIGCITLMFGKEGIHQLPCSSGNTPHRIIITHPIGPKGGLASDRL